MGKRTTEALREFQREHGLTETGSLDQATKAALQPPLPAKISPVEIMPAPNGSIAGSAPVMEPALQPLSAFAPPVSPAQPAAITPPVSYTLEPSAAPS